jgi:hypothetical protein
MTGGIGRNQKPGAVVKGPKQPLNRIAELLCAGINRRSVVNERVTR